jgi:hypothetical protein
MIWMSRGLSVVDADDNSNVSVIGPSDSITQSSPLPQDVVIPNVVSGLGGPTAPRSGGGGMVDSAKVVCIPSEPPLLAHDSTQEITKI